MRRREFILVPPAVESLLATGAEDSLWPEDLKNNPDIISQTGLRRNLYKKMDFLFRRIPQATMDISSAVDTRKIEPEIVAQIYGLLSDFLEADTGHKRLVLYLPFELIPDKTWRPQYHELADSVRRFIGSYTNAWNELLQEIDVRSNFSNGSILEPELGLGGQPMVCKAAHLIPWLVKKGLVATNAVLRMADSNTDEILKKSICDALPVLVDMSLASAAESGRIKLLCVFSSYVNVKKQAALPFAKEKGAAWLNKMSADSEFELRKIEMRYALDQSRGWPMPRVAWEKSVREDRLVERYSEIIAAMLVEGSLTSEDIRNLIASTAERIPCFSAVDGIRKAAEFFARNNLKRAKEMFFSFDGNIRGLWLRDDPGMRDMITMAVTRLAYLGVTDREYLEKFGLKFSELDAVFSDNSPFADEIRQFAPAIKLIAADPWMKDRVYPAAIFYGSRLKGYAKLNADLDVAVFVRPDVRFAERPKIQKELKRVFENKRIDGKIVEFWLTEENGKLRVRDFSNADVFLADSTWMHLLFASVWFGKEKAISELYEKLLPGFIYSKGLTFEGYDKRKIWLGEMEREVLQYRLMHKGYKRLYPEEGGIDTEHSRGLDIEGSFWDSGFRRVATKLFISRIFLPQLE